MKEMGYPRQTVKTYPPRGTKDDMKKAFGDSDHSSHKTKTTGHKGSKMAY